MQNVTTHSYSRTSLLTSLLPHLPSQVMMQNVINTAFDGAATTAAGVELLEAFSSLAKRDSIKRCVEKKSAEVFQTFAQELGHVKSTFDKLKGSPPLIHRDHPRFAGGALWAKSLHARITKQWEMLDAARSFLAPSREAEDAGSLNTQPVSDTQLRAHETRESIS